MHKFRVLTMLLLGWLALAACRPPAEVTAGPPVTQATVLQAGAASPAHTPSPQPVEEHPPASPLPAPSVTPSPTEQARPTQTPLPWRDYPAPTTTLSTAVPPPAEPFALPPEIEIMALLGTDTEAPRVGRTDTILLAFYNRESGAVSLVSIPRDLYVYIPGWTMDRVNTAFFRGGFDLFALTLEYNLGVRPQGWILAHFSDFIRFIDDLGGISVPVSDPLPGDCGGIPSGTVHLDGAAALCYLRERKTTSDFARSVRQQEVLQAILDRVLSLDGLRRLPEWYALYQGAVQTDQGLEDLLAFIPMILKVQDAGMHKFQIDWDEVDSWQVPDTGARVVLPRRERITPILRQAVDVLMAPIPTSTALATRIAALTATSTPTPSETPTPLATATPEPTSTVEAMPTETPSSQTLPTESIPPTPRQTPTLAPIHTRP